MRSRSNFRLAEQLRCATLNIAEMLLTVSSATFSPPQARSAPLILQSLHEKYRAAAAISPRREVEDANRICSGFTCNLANTCSRWQPAFSPES